MEMLSKICSTDTTLLLATPYRVVDLNDPLIYEDAIVWWTEMTASGGEGLVEKPLNFISKGRRGTTQPAIKCGGPEYLRITYGPEYLLPGNLDRLRSRDVGVSVLSSTESASGIEDLERVLRPDALRRTHDCLRRFGCGKQTARSSVSNGSRRHTKLLRPLSARFNYDFSSALTQTIRPAMSRAGRASDLWNVAIPDAVLNCSLCE